MPRRLAAGVLSLLLTLAGGVLVIFGGLMAGSALGGVFDAAEGRMSWPTVVVVALMAVAVLVAGVMFIGRVRPWVVRRLAGVEVPRLPWLLSEMWNNPPAGGGG